MVILSIKAINIIIIHIDRIDKRDVNIHFVHDVRLVFLSIYLVIY